jgi:hypothetical protein
MYGSKIYPGPETNGPIAAGIAAAAGTPQQVQAAFTPPLSVAYANSGVALAIIRQNWADIDRVQLMTCMRESERPAHAFHQWLLG